MGGVERDIDDLPKNPANYTALTPLGFLERAALVHPTRKSVVHGSVIYTWQQTYRRCRQLASALTKRGVTFGSTTIAFLLGHSQSAVIMVDQEFYTLAEEALKIMADTSKNGKFKPPILIVIADENCDPKSLQYALDRGAVEYEKFLETGDPEFAWKPPEDEWHSIALGYTSGTTASPKGVVLHHRGAYLMALSNAVVWGMNEGAFTCGLCPCSIVMVGVSLGLLQHFVGQAFALDRYSNCICISLACITQGLNATFLFTMLDFPISDAMVTSDMCECVRVTAKGVYSAIANLGVTHFCAAPVVLNTIVNAPKKETILPLPRVVHVMTAGAAPPPSVLFAMAQRGFRVAHTYGLSETYGPSTICAWKPEWDSLPPEDQARLNARQGVRYVALEGLDVVHTQNMTPVPADGKTVGEIVFRGNAVMKGYLKNPKANEEAFSGGWFHSGDLGVKHPDGYIEIKDRSKDIIISGGENISSVEVENILYQHPAIFEVSVVARPDERWGESPCAFVTLKPDVDASDQQCVAEDIMSSVDQKCQDTGFQNQLSSDRCLRQPPGKSRSIC
ncbi:Acetate/butyrate--CoA ligase AAE7, peroxisomal [Sesamum angolense]|uniref:Acetate/butyrate--CoA ligase AAE7, peroxisomal n=1 Tax=Sesamum angolense TaxID=2727404 RepID=A0AAE1X607_9LAMI|nr:Acetate/butyrate--CoA ligase AAE7, peroxisomal [Sesamum angolense]